jgi:hypothetical protein
MSFRTFLRGFLVVFLVIECPGCILDRYTEFQFMTGTAVIFVSVAVMEGVDSSLMSKVRGHGRQQEGWWQEV